MALKIKSSFLSMRMLCGWFGQILLLVFLSSTLLTVPISEKLRHHEIILHADVENSALIDARR